MSAGSLPDCCGNIADVRGSPRSQGSPICAETASTTSSSAAARLSMQLWSVKTGRTGVRWSRRTSSSLGARDTPCRYRQRCEGLLGRGGSRSILARPGRCHSVRRLPQCRHHAERSVPFRTPGCGVAVPQRLPLIGTGTRLSTATGLSGSRASGRRLGRLDSVEPVFGEAA